jgi:hypothetical protein
MHRRVRMGPGLWGDACAGAGADTGLKTAVAIVFSPARFAPGR